MGKANKQKHTVKKLIIVMSNIITVRAHEETAVPVCQAVTG